MTGEERAREIDVFGGNAKTAAMAIAEIGSDIGKIRHRFNVDPGFRHGNHHIRRTKAKRRDDVNGAFRVGDVFMHQIQTRDPEMDRAVG